jgi:hypothetical protein
MEGSRGKLAQSTEHKGQKPSAKGGSTVGALDEALLAARSAMKAGDAFGAAELASKALREARAKRSFASMAAILPVLRDARCAIRDKAIAAKKIFRIDAWTETDEPEAGLWLIEPPAVGADGRMLRDRALEARIPVLVLVREPETRDGRWPMVMVGPATTRTKVEPPSNDKPTPGWLLAALESLAQSAVDSVDGSAPETRVNQLCDRLETIPEAETMYDELANACLQAAAAHADAESRRRPSKEA